jgi:hypothetical protein
LTAGGVRAAVGSHENRSPTLALPYALLQAVRDIPLFGRLIYLGHIDALGNEVILFRRGSSFYSMDMKVRIIEA